MPPAEMHALLQSANFGHLGCAHRGRPYVLPMHYAYDGKELYFFTTQGMKTQFMNGNPEVCLQVEQVTDSSHWRSVMVVGRAEKLTDRGEVERAMKQITERDPSLTSTLHATQPDVALYRIQPELIDGRKTA
jgi:hypothetical protein